MAKFLDESNRPIIMITMLRFVIQRHRLTDQDHWDLMLEYGDSLATWQVPTPPESWSGQPIKCRQLPPHRLAYLTYEGPISQNRGHVTLAAKGHYELKKNDSKHWHVTIIGNNMQGDIDLEQITDENWNLTFSGVAS